MRNPRKKDLIRSRVAYERPRINGLFVSKMTERQLGAPSLYSLWDSDETDDPD